MSLKMFFFRLPLKMLPKIEIGGGRELRDSTRRVPFRSCLRVLLPPKETRPESGRWQGKQRGVEGAEQSPLLSCHGLSQISESEQQSNECIPSILVAIRLPPKACRPLLHLAP